MASLSIRKLDNHVYEALRIKAAEHGVSMEEEARRIISQIIFAPTDIVAVFSRYFGKDNGIELKLPERKTQLPLKFE